MRTLDELNRNGGVSGWDGWDNYAGDRTRDDWLILLGRNRDSDVLTESNFASALKMLGGESDNVEVHRFGHWACGWFELLMIRPGSEAVSIAEDIEGSLENYPVLDDTDYSEREYEEFEESWEFWGRQEFTRAIANAFELSDEAEDLLEESDRLQEFFCEHNPYGFSSIDEMSGAIEQVVKDMDEDDLDFLVEVQVTELKRVAVLKVLKEGGDLYGDELRWRWDDRIRFPWEQYLEGDK